MQCALSLALLQYSWDLRSRISQVLLLTHYSVQYSGRSERTQTFFAKSSPLLYQYLKICRGRLSSTKFCNISK
jgi:hypothetical protein